ncbi:DUF305 domain-containing protein [Jidongwangia harbinensis]|uniref:DUF305 domain-containing protein n=1 Tax=Jidongwangia harbinensis TaxID=2878561 RepID=UPI001CD93229|nr:DUF305 domain-containing protein [Jidongwangia harbinensis]MCA2213188.1 DUF305 domain-containing protein [Jidongwangia harbinensis]
MSRQRISTLVAAVVVVLAAGGAVIAARSGGSGSAAAPRASAAPPVRVVVPGRPGESAVVTDSDRLGAPEGSTYNAVDTTFVQMMIVHHGQAVTMADLAAERAGSAGVRSLASRISAAQKPEIEVLRAWLQSRKLAASDPRHDHATMPGMQSEADLAALAAARGTEFDRRFITMMTAHHQGAIRMAGDALAGGTDQTVQELANEMAVEQGSEIRRMRQLGVR